MSDLNTMILDNLNDGAEEIAADCISTSASEASSKGSNNSEPPLLDFIGTACMASAWFTSCFPCAVVDINDSDNKVVDKLSRQSAMNAMYGANDRPQVILVPTLNGNADDRDESLKVPLPIVRQDSPSIYSIISEGPSRRQPLKELPINIIEEDGEEEEDEPGLENMEYISLANPFPQRTESDDDIRDFTPLPEKVFSPSRKKFSIRSRSMKFLGFGKRKE